MAEDLYDPASARPNQGDIFDLVPHIVLEKPLLALRKEGETIFQAFREPFSEFDDKNGQPVVTTCRRITALLLSHDCEIDKPQVLRWLICPVVPAVRLRPDTQDRLKRNRIYSMLHLPAYRDLLRESFVDFNQISTIDRELVTSSKKLLTLSDKGRRALYAQFVRWLTRWELRTIACPNCAAAFNPVDVLPVRS